MRASHTAKLLVTLTSAASCWGAIYENAADLPREDFDFVVIGGGAAGNVIANRLTENPNFSVLVLEAGPSNEGVINAMVPLLNGFLRKSPYDWNYTTTAQEELNGRTLDYPRGYILGGCTSMNGMIYTRGSSDDYNRYARVTHDSGWSWNSLQPYIRKNEQWSPPADHHNTAGQFNPSVHGFHGINGVSLTGYPQSTNDRVIQATTELSNEFPFNLDMNSGSPLGLGWMQATIRNGQRSSSATSYLGPEFINRPNLHVLVKAQVTQILRANSHPGKIAFGTVEFAQSKGGTRRRVTASKEVVLSAGIIGTPQILLNSGIGDENELTPLGIQALVHLPDVGKNFSEHPKTTFSYFVNSTKTIDDIFRNSTLRDELLQQWNQTRTGPLVIPGSTHDMFVRMPRNATIFENHPDPAAGPHTGHFLTAILNGSPNPPPVGNFITIIFLMVTPASRGSVSLRSNNPFDPPIINPRYLSNDFDIFAVREGIKAAQRFLSAPAWKDYVLDPVGNIANATTDAELEEWIRANVDTAGHAVGTASMSPKGANYGVVDPDLRVKGVSGLRIVDASVLPFIPSANSQAAIYSIAERAADLIKAAWQ